MQSRTRYHRNIIYKKKLKKIKSKEQPLSKALHLAEDSLSLRLFNILWRMLVVNTAIVPISTQIHVRGANKPCAFDELPANIHHDHDGDFDVIGHKLHALEVRAKARPALHQDEDGIESDRKDGAVGVEVVLEGKKVFETLGPDSAAEAKRRNANTDPGELVGDTNDASSVSLSSGIGNGSGDETYFCNQVHN